MRCNILRSKCLQPRHILGTLGIRDHRVRPLSECFGDRHSVELSRYAAAFALPFSPLALPLQPFSIGLDLHRGSCGPGWAACKHCVSWPWGDACRGRLPPHLPSTPVKEPLCARGNPDASRGAARGNGSAWPPGPRKPLAPQWQDARSAPGVHPRRCARSRSVPPCTLGSLHANWPGALGTKEPVPCSLSTSRRSGGPPSSATCRRVPGGRRCPMSCAPRHAHASASVPHPPSTALCC